MAIRLFDNRYARIQYIEEDGVILLTWKQKCSHDDYRKPALTALSSLQEYPDSNLVIDAGVGFENAEEDVAWGVNMLLPTMAKTTCKAVAMIAEGGGGTTGEMDRWEREFQQYFKVSRVDSYEKAAAFLKAVD